MQHRIRQAMFLAFALCFPLTGCGLNQQTKLLGRWYNSQISIRFVENNMVVYNSRTTGLVRGRYQFTPTTQAVANDTPKKNLTLWLPQTGRILVLDYELKYLGDDRLQLTRLPAEWANSQQPSSSPSRAIVLKRALPEEEGSNGFDKKHPIAEATPHTGS
ncbi:MAG: hypothetical protein KDA84_03340 [Planctomycetaceae bacterium]|nr:hypothetical protein [Planctomycetaceae bacterium]